MILSLWDMCLERNGRSVSARFESSFEGATVLQKETKQTTRRMTNGRSPIICQSGPLRWQQRVFGGSKGIFELREVALRDGMPGNSVAARPGVFRQIIGPKQTVEQRKMNGKININRSRFDSVVPMVKARAHQDFFEQSQAPAHIGVHE